MDLSLLFLQQTSQAVKSQANNDHEDDIHENNLFDEGREVRKQYSEEIKSEDVESNDEEQAQTENRKRSRKEAKRFTLDFGPDRKYGKGAPLVTYKDRVQPKRRRSNPSTISKPKLQGAPQPQLFDKSPSTPEQSSMPTEVKRKWMRDRTKDCVGRELIEGLNGRDLNLEKTFSLETINEKRLQAKIKEFSRDDINLDDVLMVNQSVVNASNMYPLLMSLHGPVFRTVVLPASQTAVLLPAPSSSSSSSAMATCTEIDDTKETNRTRNIEIEEYFLLPQPYYHKGFPIIVAPPSTHEDVNDTNESGLNPSLPPVTCATAPPTSSVFDQEVYNPNVESVDGPPPSQPITTTTTAIATTKIEPIKPKTAKRRKSVPLRYPPITMWTMPFLKECHLVGGGYPLKVSFFSRIFNFDHMIGYIFSADRDERGYAVFFQNKDEVFVEHKFPFEFSICVIVKEDRKILPMLSDMYKMIQDDDRYKNGCDRMEDDEINMSTYTDDNDDVASELSSLVSIGDFEEEFQEEEEEEEEEKEAII